MDAVFDLLQSHDPANNEQSRALLCVAVWLQCRMSDIWAEDGTLEPSPYSSSASHVKELLMVLLGPGGTGKTTVLRVQEALIDHFAGPEAVRKCAISNTAARLLGGDAMHALCKLPPYGLHGKRGRLSDAVLRNHRQKWDSAHAVFMDEVSMVGNAQLHQCDVRIRQAKQEPLMRF